MQVNKKKNKIKYNKIKQKQKRKEAIIKLLPHETTVVIENSLEKFLTKFSNMPRALILSKKPSISPTVKQIINHI